MGHRLLVLSGVGQTEFFAGWEAFSCPILFGAANLSAQPICPYGMVLAILSRRTRNIHADQRYRNGLGYDFGQHARR